MQSVIKRPCPATRIHFQPYGQPNVERKTTTGERHPAQTRGRHIGRPYRAYVNYIRRAGCPPPAASSCGSPSTGSHPRRGRRPRRPGNRPSPGKPPGRACPAPTARRWASPMPSINAHGGVKTPPYEPTHQRVPAPTARRWASPMPSVNAHGGVKTPPYEPTHQRVPAPYRAAVRERRQKNRGDPFSRDCLGSLL